MGMAEPDNRLIVVLIAGTILVNLTLITAIHVMGNSICFGTQLYNSERRTGTGESMAHAIGTDNGIHVIQVALPLGKNICRKGKKRNSNDRKLIHLL